MICTETDDLGIVGMIATWAREIMASRACNEIIQRHGSPFAERWMIGRKLTIPTFVASRTDKHMAFMRPDDPTLIPSEIENVYLNRYSRSDGEDLHCHPWDNGSLILAGSIEEEDAAGNVFIRRPGDVVLRRAEEAHAIRGCEPGTISLFGTGPKRREWGFYPDGVFVHHSDYRAYLARMLT